MSLYIAPGVIIVLLLTACTAPSLRPASPSMEGHVGIALADSAIQAGSRLQLAVNERFQPALPSGDNAPPHYPDELLAQRLPPQAVCLRVAIDEQGRVFDKAFVDHGADCSDTFAVNPAFHNAALAATSCWHFEPAFRCVFPEGQTPGSACGSKGTREVPQPVSLVYRFVFQQVNGQGQVRID